MMLFLKDKNTENTETRTQAILRPFDPSLTDVTADSFADYIKECTAFLKLPHAAEDELAASRERILSNIAKMLLAAVDIPGIYEPLPAAHDEIWEALSRLLAGMEDDLIKAVRTSRYCRMFLLHLKYARQPQAVEWVGDVRFYYGDTELYPMGQMLTRIEIIEFRDNALLIEGCLKLPEVLDGNALELVCYNNNRAIPCTPVSRCADEYIFGRKFQTTHGFSLTIPLDSDHYKITFGIRGFGLVSVCRTLDFTHTSPLGKKLENAYYYKNGYVVKVSKNALLCLACDEDKHAFYEKLLRQEIKKLAGDAADAIIALRQYYAEHRSGGEDIWLMMDRPDRADDNAEALFRYAAEKAFDRVKPVFIVNKASAQFEELSRIGDVYEYRSDAHLKAFLTSKYVISSHFSPASINPFNEDFDYFRDIVRDKKFVFLQHGVMHNDSARAFSHYARNYYGIVASGNEEYTYLCSPKLSNDPATIWLTGLPRFDRLLNRDRRVITIMPTWRKNLTTRVYDEAQRAVIWQVKDNFNESEYFRFYNALINDERLIKAARENRYTIQLMPHVHFLKRVDDFEIREKDVVSLCHYDTRYSDVFSESSLILTDYSSIVFDFVYLYKPVLYCQFDKEAFFKNHTVRPGYFSFEDNGFGEVLYQYEDTVNALIAYMKNGCRMKDVYRERVDRFFRYHDRGACERVCARL